MFQFENSARVLAGVVAVLGAAGSAVAGVPAADYTTIHSALMSFNYSGVNGSVTESGNHTLFLTDPVSYVAPFGPESLNFGNAGSPGTGDATWYLAGGYTDPDGAPLGDVLAGFVFFDPVFNVQSFAGLWTFDVEFQSAQGGVAITSLEPPFAIDGLSVSMTNALGEAVDLSVGTILANGRYSITASYQDFDFNGLPFNGFGFGMTVDAAVPAPGAIALLGLAGLAGRRRR